MKGKVSGLSESQNSLSLLGQLQVLLLQAISLQSLLMSMS